LELAPRSSGPRPRGALTPELSKAMANKQASAEGVRAGLGAPKTRGLPESGRAGIETGKGEAPMKEYDFSAGGKLQRRKADHPEEKVQYTSSLEEHVLQSISARAPLPKVLNEICSVLDCQIGNVVSLVSLPGDDAGDLEAIARNAALFGLYTFCSEGVFAESDELLGFLEMYSSVARSPNASEFQLIERAMCLAAIAIKRHNEASAQGNCEPRGTMPVRGRLLEWPVLMN
jgi:hypothetical protein